MAKVYEYEVIKVRQLAGRVYQVGEKIAFTSPITKDFEPYFKLIGNQEPATSELPK